MSVVTKSAPPSPKGRFEFVTVASARARQLMVGCVPKIEGSAKLARRAQQEVNSGAVQRNDSSAE